VKLHSLKLERFGHFQGATLEFSDGLQLLSGQNEAGKSTLVAALRALLFKYPPGQYDFRFPEATLAVSARLQFSDGTIAEVRREKNKGWKGQIGADKLSDDAFKDKLGRPSQELFANVFAFGLYELARGAESIQEAGLSAAISGAGIGVGVGPDALLAELKKQADELWSERASKKPINQLLAEIRELKKLLRDSELRGERFRALEDALAEKKARATALRAEREAVLRRTHLIETALQALPLAGARLALEQLGPTVPLPASAEGDYRRLMAERERLAARLGELDGKLARNRSELASLVEPESGAVDPRLAALAEAWSGHLQRREQLEEATAERERLQKDKQRLRARLDPPWPQNDGGDAPLPVPRAEEVRQYKGLIDGAMRKQEAAARDRDRAARELQQASEQAAQKAGEAPSADELARLRAERDALWEKVRKSWLEDALSDAEGSGALFIRAGNRQLAAALVAATAAADAYADELRRRADDVAAAASACTRRDERARALASAEGDLAAAGAAAGEATAAWNHLWDRCGFLPHSPDAMMEWLADYQALVDTGAQLESALGRAARLETATRDYDAALRAAGDGTIETLRRRLQEQSAREEERIRVAEKKRHLSRTHEDLREDHQQARALLAARLEELAAARARAAADDCGDDGFLDAAARARQAHELKQEIARAERTLAEAHIAAADLDEALARGREALAAEKSDLQQARARLESELQEADRAVGAAETELRPFDGRSQAVTLQAQLEAKRAELRDRAAEWARLASARDLLERQLQRFSARDQPRLLESVGKLFAAMTRGRYTRVFERLDRTFMAVRSDGVEVEPQHLSTATREQLYLAVRLAWIDSYCARSEPLPLCLDDVLVNFDDERAEATLAVLSRFAAEGRIQVLLLTCHPHLLQVARKVLPQSKALPLPPSA
jgi:uncharacterized protein YhaN